MPGAHRLGAGALQVWSHQRSHEPCMHGFTTVTRHPTLRRILVTLPSREGWWRSSPIQYLDFFEGAKATLR